MALSPNIFKKCLNDLNISIESSGIGATLLNKNIGCLLYADDLVLISHSKNGWQKQLNILNEYCTEWCLSVNISKTKVIIFNKTGYISYREPSNRMCYKLQISWYNVTNLGKIYPG